MVLIGFLKQEDMKEVADYSKELGLYVYEEYSLEKEVFLNSYEKKVIENYHFFNVENENLKSRAFCCLGNSEEYNGANGIVLDGLQKIEITNKPLYNKLKNILQKEKPEIIELFNTDINFWLSTAKKLVDEFSVFCLCRYYPNFTSALTVESKDISSLNKENLLDMDCNQIYIISKQTQGDGSVS